MSQVVKVTNSEKSGSRTSSTNVRLSTTSVNWVKYRWPTRSPFTSRRAPNFQPSPAPLGNPTIPPLATPLGLHRHYAWQEAGGADRTAKGPGHGYEEQSDGKSLLWAANVNAGQDVPPPCHRGHNSTLIESTYTQFERLQNAKSEPAAPYPNLWRWLKAGGAIEMGLCAHTGFFIRIVYQGGLIGKAQLKYPSLDDALADAEVGLVAWTRQAGIQDSP